jgi:ubiquinone/menaquinone biosynthesis C-methylase UbiE
MRLNLLKKYPKIARNIKKRKILKNKSIINIARKFDYNFFDGDRKYGYGGFKYNKKYWRAVVKDFIKYYKLTNKSSILDVGCAKGFMLYEFKKELPGATLKGIDISTYAIENAKKEVKKYLNVANAKKLPFDDKSFDLVICINTVHNLNKNNVAKAIKEIIRVSKKFSYIVVDAYKNPREKKRMMNWNLTGKTILHESNWVNLFKKNGYKGDYYWFKA